MTHFNYNSHYKPIMQILITFHDYDYDIYWKADVSDDDYKLLKKEIRKYNKWINLLHDGLADDSSYEEQYTKEHRRLAASGYHKDANGNSIHRGYFEDWSIYFRISKIVDDINTYEYSDDTSESSDSEVDDVNGKTFESFNELKRIIETPLDDYDAFSMGYKMLPITQKIYDSFYPQKAVENPISM